MMFDLEQFLHTKGKTMAETHLIGANRQGAETMLKHKVSRLRQEAEELDALIGELPQDLSEGAEHALWRLVSTQR